MIDEETLRVYVRRRMDEERENQKSFAYKLGVSEQQLSDFLCGRRHAGPKLAGALGFEQVVAFVPIES